MTVVARAHDDVDLPDPDVRHVLDALGAALAGPANVIMQLSLAPVGHGVVESRVESGQVTRHPLKRARTTYTYLAVALLGTGEDRARYRAAVDGVHRLVRSEATSPVRYNAFDPALQLWVAACLYRGTEDLHRRLHAPASDRELDSLYRHCGRFGTTLQVRPSSWPADRDAFEGYWQRTVATLSLDEPVRDYLLDLAALRHLPGVPAPVRRASVWVTTGFLPEPFRDAMGLTWSARDQARFDRLLARLAAVERCVPATVRVLPFTLLLRDMRRRARRGRPLV